MVTGWRVIGSVHNVLNAIGADCGCIRAASSRTPTVSWALRYFASLLLNFAKQPWRSNALGSARKPHTAIFVHLL